MSDVEQQKQDAVTGTLPDAAPAGLITGILPGIIAPAPINEAGYTLVDGVEEGDQLAVLDTSPRVHTFIVTPQSNGTTILSARVFHPLSGWQNKQQVAPGELTAKQISDHLLNVTNW